MVSGIILPAGAYKNKSNEWMYVYGSDTVTLTDQSGNSVDIQNLPTWLPPNFTITPTNNTKVLIALKSDTPGSVKEFAGFLSSTALASAPPSGITDITSADNTVAITNPTGPTTDLSVTGVVNSVTSPNGTLDPVVTAGALTIDSVMTVQGDVVGNLNTVNNSVSVAALHGNTVGIQTPNDGDVFTWVGIDSQWEPVAPAGATAKSMVMFGTYNGNIAAGSDAFGGPNCGTTNSSEGDCETPVSFDFTARNLVMLIQSNTNSSGTGAITIRKTGADTAITISVAAGVTGYMTDLTNTASFSQGDRLDIHFDMGSMVGGNIQLQGSLELDA